MLFRIALVLVYLVIIFIGFRVVDVSLSLIGVTSLPVLCKLLQDTWMYGCCSERHQEQQQEDFSSHHSSRLQEDKASNADIKADGKNVDFSSYEHFLENVEDTKAGVWVVWVRPGSKRQPSTLQDNHAKSIASNQCGRNESVLNSDNWSLLSKMLFKYGIRTGTYKCARDTRLCKAHHINGCSILLSMPAGSKPKGKVAIYLFRNKSSCNSKEAGLKVSNCLLSWIKTKLKSRVLILNTYEELSAVVRQTKLRTGTEKHPGLNLIYESTHKYPPLLFSALSVKFTGRIKFVQLKSLTDQHNQTRKSGLSKLHSFYAVTSASNYSYGFKKGEEFDYSNIEIFLKTLHPEINDVFLITLVLINMCCLLELFIRKGGPLKRLLCCFWTALLSNVLLLSVWLPVTKILQLPQAGPVIDFFLKTLQTAMLSDIASMIRKDFLLLSHNFEMFFVGLVFYGSVVGYIKYKLTNRESSGLSLAALWHEDLRELQQFLHSLRDLAAPSLLYYNFEEQLETLLQHLAVPSLWLHAGYNTDYVNQLFSWRICINSQLSSELSSNNKVVKQCSCNEKAHKVGSNVINSQDCIICLEEYLCGDVVKLLPCGHFFHNACIDSWLLSGPEARNRKCPVCRWPAKQQRFLT